MSDVKHVPRTFSLLDPSKHPIPARSCEHVPNELATLAFSDDERDGAHRHAMTRDRTGGTLQQSLSSVY